MSCIKGSRGAAAAVLAWEAGPPLRAGRGDNLAVPYYALEAGFVSAGRTCDAQFRTGS